MPRDFFLDGRCSGGTEEMLMAISASSRKAEPHS